MEMPIAQNKILSQVPDRFSPKTVQVSIPNTFVTDKAAIEPRFAHFHERNVI